MTSGIYNGLRLPQVPDFLASVNLNFRHAFIGKSTIVANVLYSVQFGGLQELRNPPVRLDDYDLINLRLGVEVGTMLDVLERAKRDIEEVARSAGGVEHPEFRQAVDEAFVYRLGFRERPGPLGKLGAAKKLFLRLHRRRFDQRGHLR